jgi:hypothetical protein
MVEFSSVDFRCAKNGARFTVNMSRRSPLHKFIIQEIKRATSRSARALPTESGPPQSASKEGTPFSTRRGWLTRIWKGKASLPSTQPAPAPVSKDEPAGMPAPTATRDSSEYNWSGWRCPYCDASSFVHCRAGGHLVCDGTTELREGRRFHQCFCGNAAYLEGFIKAIEDTRRLGGTKVDAPNPLYQKMDGSSEKVTGIVVAAQPKGGPPVIYEEKRGSSRTGAIVAPITKDGPR